MTSDERRTANAGAAAESTPAEQPVPIVGIGASAGGVESLREFLGAMPVDSGMAFVVVQHLQHGRRSLMDEVLANFTAMPVVHAEDGMPVAPDRVHVLPADALLTMRDGALRVEHWGGDDMPRRMPIDTFLRSLADDQDRNAVAVIMSGAGSDGTLGVRAIKEHGGLAMAETFAATRGEGGFDSMPQSAVATGLVDFVVPAREMPERLVAYARHLNEVKQAKGIKSVEADAREYLREICAILLARKGRDFRHYKTNTLVRRIQRRMQVLRMDAAAAYVQHLREDAQEVERLAHELLITVTSFFRDPDAFDALKRLAIRPLVQEKAADEAIRIWVPGCGTGEEAYSIAVLLREACEAREWFPPVKVFATDIDETAIESARTGRYPKSVAEDISPDRLQRFFVEEEEHYRVVKDVREMCIFSVHDLIQNPPFSNLDLISCRNVLIYFDADLQRRLVPVFHYALREGGMLFLGSAETVAQQQHLFDAVDKKHRIYRQRPRAGQEAAAFPLLAETQAPIMPHLPEPGEPAAGDNPQKVEKLVLDWYGPAFVVVDEQFTIVQYSRRTGRYLEQPSGAPRSNLLELARPGLRVDLQDALKAASEQQQEAVRPAVRVRSDDRTDVVDVIATPVSGKSAAPRYLVVFRAAAPQPAERTPDAANAGAEPAEEAGDGRVYQLERELAATKEDLQSTIEEMETSNEELKSANEELLSMNEELQSSNEELETTKEEVQSVNEELETVNQELNRKVAELDETNTDLRNLLQSTDVATVFLDRQAHIKWYSPAAKRVFNLIDSDINRPITDITAQVGLAGLQGDIDATLRGNGRAEREVVSHDGATVFAMRVLPYLDSQGRMDGVVLTFVDITDLKTAQAQSERRAGEARQALADLKALLDIAPVGIAIAHDPEGATLSVNRAAGDMLGGTEERTVVPGAPDAEHHVERHGEPVDAAQLPLQRALRSGETVGHEEVRIVSPDGGAIEVLMTAAPLLDDAGRVRGAVTVFDDITETKAAQRRQALLVAALQHRVNNVLAAVRALERETCETSATLAEFAERFEGRLDALAISEAMMARTGLERVDLHELVEEALPRALYSEEAVTVGGPAVSLSRRAGQLMALAINELFTNAIKHGALAASEGRIEVRWQVASEDAGQMLRFSWTEHGLDAVPDPAAEDGFGLDLIRTGLPYELGGSGEVRFDPGGIACTILLPLDGVVTTLGGCEAEGGDGDGE